MGEFMYKAVFIIDNYKFNGTLDMYVIKKVQEELERCNKNLKVYEIFKRVANLDMYCISAIILKSILRCGDISEEDFLTLYLKDRDEEELKVNINNSIEFLNELFKKCMPKNLTNGEDDEFEEILDDKDIKDWDFPYMEYIWTPELKKNDFWSVTPRNFFEQIEIHRRLSGDKFEDENIEYL